MTDYSIIMTTCENEEQAEKVAGALLAAKLAACVCLQNVKSRYIWEGAVEKSEEVLLIIKTKARLYKEAEQCIRQNHTYEVPEIVSMSIEGGAESYLAWIDEVTKG